MLLINYLKTACRNVMRYRVYSALNVVGLSIGIAGCLLVMMFVRREMSVDAFHTFGDRTYRVVRETVSSSKEWFYPRSDGPLASALRAEYPEVEATLRMWPEGGMLALEDKQIGVSFTVADPNYFEFFSIPLIVGNPKDVLNQPNTVVISKRKAESLFGQTDALGRSVILKEPTFAGVYQISGVMEHPLGPTHLTYDLVVSSKSTSVTKNVENIRKVWDKWWPRAPLRPLQTYVRLKADVSPETLEAKLPRLIAQYMGPEVKMTTRYHLQPLAKIHLYSQKEYGFWGGGDVDQLYILVGLALFTMVIAGANFVNLSTARASTRATEVGLRKVVGAHKHQLISQFLGEAILLAVLSTVLGFVLAEAANPWFNGLAIGYVRYGLQVDVWMWGMLPVLAVVIGILAGLYPALFLSRLQAVSILKGSSGKRGADRGVLRKALVMVQFSMAILLMIVTGAVYLQLQYMTHKDLGFDKEQIIVLPMFQVNRNTKAVNAPRLANKSQTVKDAVSKHPNILNTSAFRFYIGWQSGISAVVRPEASEAEWRVRVNDVDDGFLDVFGIPIVAGRGFHQEESSSSFIINETAAKMFGWENAIGKKIDYPNWNITGTVVGVMKDFHAQSLRKKIAPIILRKRHGLFNYLAVKIGQGDLINTMAFLEQNWNHFVPGQDFDPIFFDQSLEDVYKRDREFATTVSTFAGLAIFVACLGLVGLVAFLGERRAREIGIRKVLGATTTSILALLSKEFVILIGVSNVIAWPLAYVLIGRFFEDYAYRTELGFGLFVVGSAIVFVIAAVCIGFQAFRAISTNPVSVLRAE